MQMDPTEKTVSQPIALQFHMSMGTRLNIWLKGWQQIRSSVQAAEINVHLQQDIGLADVRPELRHLAARREADIRAFNLQLLRAP